VKLLVLGANSLLGRALVRLLQSQGVDYHALETHEINLLKKMEVIKVFNSIKADQIINVATYSNLEKAEYDTEAATQCDIVNTRGVSILAEACKHLDLPLFHHSSSFVFDGAKTHPYTEEDTTNPLSRYGMSKWYGERAIREVLPRHIILRTDWLFSRERPGFFLKHIESCKRQKGKLEIVNHRFSPTPAPDVARVLLAMSRQLDCSAEVWGTYHYCALQPMSQEHFVEYFLQEAGKHDEVLAQYVNKLQITKLPVQLPYISNTVLAGQRLFETFGIKQRPRAQEINALLQDIYQLQSIPEQPEHITPDKGDIADRAEDSQAAPKVRKRAKAEKPAKKVVTKKASPPA